MVNKLQQTKPKLRWKKRYWWLAFATNFSLTFSLGGLMILISQGGASFFHHFLAYGYILVSSLLIASCMFGYFFIALRDYLKHYPKLKRTKTTSLRNGLGLNFLALLCYLVVSVITLIKLEAALETNTATTGHSKIFGAISSLGFLGIFLAINILFSISGFLY